MSLSNEELKKFWDIANGLRKNLDAAEYKHIVLGLVFLKYISDSFEGRRIELEQEFSDKNGQRYKAAPDRRAAALEERDYYKEVNVFWVPVEARWDKIQANSKQPKIAEMIDEARIWKFVVSPKLVGSGTSGCARRMGALFNSLKHWLVIFAIISPDIEPVIEPESIATNRPVFFTELMMVGQSIGLRVLRSTTSQEIPTDKRRSAAVMASSVRSPEETMVTSAPSRIRRALPISPRVGDSGT